MVNAQNAESSDDNSIRDDASNEGATDVNARLAETLEQIVSATSTTEQLSTADSEVLARLQKVAEQFRQQELTIEPVLTSLIHAVNGDFAMLSTDQNETMSRAVASTLYEDSAARARMERLWHLLRERC